jgi:hypothetical protein
MLRSGLLAALLLIQAHASIALAADRAKYTVDYSVRFQPLAGTADLTIATRPGTGRLIALDLAMPADVYSDVTGDGAVVRRGDRILWEPPRDGGSLRFVAAIEHRRGNGRFDARITPDWVITRGDRLFPAAKVRATRGSGSTARLTFELPPGWTDVETPFSKVSGGAFAVTNPERRFDRPVGWIAAGKLATMRETIAGVRTTITAPQDERVDFVATFAILRLALPKMHDAFGELPEKLLLIRSGDPMWRGGLSAPQSLWLHLERPLISENGTSTLLHELIHVFTDLRGEAQDDWIGEGLAEFYSLEIARRAGLISSQRFERAIAAAERSGREVASLRAAESTRDRTRKAVALFAALDAELRADGASDIDTLTRRLMRRESVSLAELQDEAGKLEGKPSKVLADID